MSGKANVIFGAVTSAFLATGGAAYAQTQSAPAVVAADPSGCDNAIVVPGTKAVSCDVSPSAAWYTGVTPDGTGVYMNCSWKPGVGGPQFDETYSEMAQRNDRQKFAKRLQHVNGVWLATRATNLNGGSTTIEAKLEAFTQAGEIATRQCSIDTNKDERTNCTPTTPFVTDAGASIDYGRQVEGYCRNYVGLLATGGSLTNDYYDAGIARKWLMKRAGVIQELKK